ncbi:bacillithiol biosynthesis BshC [Candidatus Bathyarchaeota archaeon]|nr:bacillithiol biosynthesis BshC [Candidatus Bathyarchaeota archaeon]
MFLTSKAASTASYFSYENFEKLADACADFYHKSLDKKNQSSISERRNQLAKTIHKFHVECGTLTPSVEEAIKNLQSSSCLLLMTAHQPNLFAYSGVIRKATLNHVLAQKLSERLMIPVVSFFGIADQDFTDDRWVRSALLPDVDRKNGLLELRFDMPEKLMINKVAKPSRNLLDNWRNEIEKWMDRNFSSISRECKSFGLKFDAEKAEFTGRFKDFWALVEEAYERAENYADFNSFTTSKIVNDIWGYDTLFSRFSECQQFFEPEFCFLLSNFDKYSQYVKEATASTDNSRGVQEEEFKTVPFWYHCSCGSKARLKAEQKDVSLIGQGQCIRCGKEHMFDLGSKHAPQLSAIASRLSARSLSMPLVLFHGLGVDCYIGGVGGTEYLKQAQFVAENLNITFPPVVVWRPRDVYFGVGQLEALMLFRKLSGTFDFSQYAQVEAGLQEKAAAVQRAIDELEEKKKQFCMGSGARSEEQIQNLKALSMKQSEVRRAANFSLLARNLGLLENIAAVMNLYPCIVDYAVNVGLKETSEQWVAYLRRNGPLSSNISLQTRFDNVLACAQSVLGCE